DCSTDSSLEILYKYSYKDSRVKVLKNEINSGQGAARNLGVQNASGKYVLFVDSDDMIRTDTLKKLYDGFTSSDVSYIRFNALSFYDGDSNTFSEVKYNFGVYLKNNKVYKEKELKDIYYSF